MRQEIAGLVHQVDAQLVILDPDMDMRARDQHPPADPVKVASERIVAVAVGVVLVLPVRGRMAGHRQRGEAELAGDGGDGFSQDFQVLARVFDGVADAGADLDLAAQELGRDLVAKGCAARLHHLGRRFGKRQGFLVDEEVFLFDPHGEARFRHVPPFFRCLSVRRSGASCNQDAG